MSKESRQKERVPSFSGRIHLNINKHPIFTDSPIHRFTHSPVFHAWWPSQFLINDGSLEILATYGDALPDSFSSDLNVGDVETNNNWTELEEIYGINLNPNRLKDEPAVIKGTFGKGRVILSLIHFDTTDDENGAKGLRNLWEYLNTGYRIQDSLLGWSPEATGFRIQDKKIHASEGPELITELETAVNDLISLGIRNFLWFWRNPVLLQWRRGVRGLEYCTLYVMVKEIAEILKMHDAGYRMQDTEKHLKNQGDAPSFYRKGKTASDFGKACHSERTYYIRKMR